MPIGYVILGDLELVIAKTWGVVYDETVLSHLASLKSDPDFKPTYSVISDIRDIVANNVSQSFLSDLAARNPYDKKAMQAIIVRQDPERKMAHQWGVSSTNANAYYKVTDSLDDAIVWLGLSAKRQLINLALSEIPLD
ncbi:hypothetical protein [Teredinibacter sp. KSP-S5-2]|uniref:hypothetical protein n=1 Tax=Teredinibacter sp. KSP-S5-2 TaxID=3034506 RepID=UPI00293526A0|nr:hypothetical protein [Teredinibacter sp. KSP-S5-2]WNO10829.1 hypothetical protein P5V12_06525 [Teredinibacter sp. KSP-S5-2]